MEIKVRDADGVKIIELTGNFDWASASRVREVMWDITANGPPQVVVNLEGVYSMDSDGLAVLVMGLQRTREKQGVFHLSGLQSPVRMIFELTRFDKIFEIFVNEEDAILAAAEQV